jgi:chromosomal replication initiator protein
MNRGVWKGVVAEVELTISRAAFVTWFKNTEVLEETNSKIIVAVPNIFSKQQFEVKFNPKIKEILARDTSGPQEVEYVVKSTSKRAVISRETSSPINAVVDQRTSHTPHTTLNPKYTFDNFIVGSSNDLAYTACQTVAKIPGEKYNPLFLYGGVGLGKTHLMQAVGNEILTHSPEKVVRYISSATFVNDFIDSIRFKKKGFADKYRNVDVLIVDDIQFIASKEKTQEEFFHTFNALHQANKQIIISSDKPPRSIPTLTERLRSRFEWGMAIDIQLPDFETRCAILESKASQAGFSLERDVVEYIANNIKTNVRELEGVLNQLLANAELRGLVPDLSMVEGFVKNSRTTRPQYLTAKQVIDKTARYFQLSSDEICSARRDKHIIVPRQIAMYLLRSELHLSFPRIAQELGRKDHTTAIHSVDKIEKATKLDFTLREQVSEIREVLYV